MNRDSAKKSTPKTTIHNRFKRTPNHLLNSTVLSNISGSSGKFSSRCSSSFLNSTTVGSAPRTKKCLNAIVPVDAALEDSLIYNNYLQSVIKQQIANKNLEKRKEVLSGQLLLHKCVLFQQQQINKNTREAIAELEERSEIFKTLVSFEENLEETFKMLENFDMEKQINNLHLVLSASCKSFQLVNVRGPQTQEECDQFEKLVDECNRLCEKLISSRKDVDGVNAVGNKMKQMLALKESVNQKSLEYFIFKKEACMAFLEDQSNMLAEQFENVCLN